VLVTRQPLVTGEVIYSGGLAYTVHVVKVLYGSYEFTVTPGLPASDRGHVVVFST
jgi:hypothetical protein